MLKAAFVLPHGSMILDPLKEGLPEPVIGLNIQMHEVSRKIASIGPDLCILITPHGIALSREYGFYMNRTAMGSAEWEGDWSDYEVKVRIDQSKTTELLNIMDNNGFPVSSVTCFSQSVSAPLRWGEVVPLWFIRDIPSKFIIISLPTRRYDEAKSMVPELKAFGIVLSNYLETLDEKVILLISADLAHTHDPKGPYGFSDKAELFDSTIENWINSGLEEKILTGQAAVMLDEALSCGYTGLVILQGVVTNRQFQARVLRRSHPTYYGMIIAEIEPI